jgi:hypothetical protein
MEKQLGKIYIQLYIAYNSGKDTITGKFEDSCGELLNLNHTYVKTYPEVVELMKNAFMAGKLSLTGSFKSWYDGKHPFSPV